MRALAVWFGKRYALGLVQDLVRARRDKVAYWSGRIAVWIERTGLAVKFLASLADKLADGELTEAEATAAMAEAEKLARTITGE